MTASTTPDTTAAPLPVRFCFGANCPSPWDDHPRATVILDRGNPALDKAYHYDCLPAEHAEQHPLIAPALAATAAGQRGQDVRDVMVAHAASIAEAPADLAALHAQRAALDELIAEHTPTVEG